MSLVEQIMNGTADLANLTRANLTKAHLYGANLYGAHLYGAHLYWANLTKADLTRADLTRADLTGANLTGANLTWANLAGANLNESEGLIWGQVGPIGVGRRTLTGIWQTWDRDTPEIVLHAGCFSGTVQQFEDRCSSGGWDWPINRMDELKNECLAAAEYVTKNIETQLDGETA